MQPGQTVIPGDKLNYATTITNYKGSQDAGGVTNVATTTDKPPIEPMQCAEQTVDVSRCPRPPGPW